MELPNLIKELNELVEHRDSLNEKVRKIAFYWASWNAKKISDTDFISVVTETLKKETKEAWQEYTGKQVAQLDSENPLASLMI